MSQKEILAAGAAAAFTVDMLVYPLDTIKTRYQSQHPHSSPRNFPPTRKAPYQALGGLYQGIGSVVLATLPAAAIFFASYESAKSLLESSLPAAVPEPATHALASAGAEMASCTVLTPAEVIKQNAQVLQRSGSARFGQSSSVEAFHMLRRSGGGALRTLSRGYAILVARNLPFTAIHFPVYELFRKHIWKWRRNHWSEPSDATDSGVMDDDMAWRGPQKEGKAECGTKWPITEAAVVAAAAAAGSGALAAFITTPADVVKTRIMLGNGGPAGSSRGSRSSRLKKAGALEVARVIIRESGIKGIFRGAMLRAAWASLGAGLYLGSYEATKIWLQHRPR